MRKVELRTANASRKGRLARAAPVTRQLFLTCRAMAFGMKRNFFPAKMLRVPSTDGCGYGGRPKAQGGVA